MLSLAGCSGGSSGVLAPVQTVPVTANQTATVTVTLRDANGSPVNGTVTLAGTSHLTTRGSVTFPQVPAGTQTIRVVVNGHVRPVTIQVRAGAVLDVPITLGATVTVTPTAVPTATPNGPAPVTPPGVVFDLRGRVLVSGVPRAGIQVRIVGSTGAVTASDNTVSGAGGAYSFFLGAGTYAVIASNGARTVRRTVTIPAGGQIVDNFDLNL